MRSGGGFSRASLTPAIIAERPLELAKKMINQQI
jgi:hypothetical protein